MAYVWTWILWILGFLSVCQGLLWPLPSVDLLESLQMFNATGSASNSPNSASPNPTVTPMTLPAGAALGPGPHSIAPALYLTGDNREMKLPDAAFYRVVSLLRSHADITFVTSLRQEPLNTGTLFSLAEGFTRFLEVQSSGRRDELRFHYSSAGSVHVETFNLRLADAQWHRLAVSVSGDMVTVYLDCIRVYRRALKPVEKTLGAPGQDLSLWIGQRGQQHFLFKGAFQDMKIIGGANGHLVQCPNLQVELQCPTCGEFGSLKMLVERLEKTVQDLADKLEAAEDRLSQLEDCDCQRSCKVNGSVHVDGASWQDGCQVCSCVRGTVSCRRLQCPATACKNPVEPPGECCPTCLKQCYFKGVFYGHGESTSPRHCVDCECRDGSMQCKRTDPQVNCPTLSCPQEEQFSVPGECCKFCPGVDYCGRGHKCSANASCHNLQTTYACQCNAGFVGDGKTCTDIDECATVGGPEGHRCQKNTVCVNTIGSYVCECAPGFVRLDDYNCVEHDACASGTHQCHPNARCVHSPENLKAGGTGYECQCMDGYSGDGYSCSPICNPICQNGGQCTAPDTCTCRKGFLGSQCELDVDECALGIHQCHDHSRCVNYPGWYQCPCLEGYQSLLEDTMLGQLCQDIDECALGTHTCPPNAICVNTPGGYTCQCPSSQPNCTLGCVSLQGIQLSGSGWISRSSPCTACHCQNGVTRCVPLQCQCQAGAPSSVPRTRRENEERLIEIMESGGLASPAPTKDLLKPGSSVATAAAPASSVTVMSEVTLVNGTLWTPSVGAALITETVITQCCPQCRQPPPGPPPACRHQELSHVTFRSGQNWTYQCQTCECLHGEIDCWPLKCPPVYCTAPVEAPGDCCRRCPEHDPCRPVPILSSSPEDLYSNLTYINSSDSSSTGQTLQGCHVEGRYYAEGALWHSGIDGCIACTCKEGKLCCRTLPRCLPPAPAIPVSPLPAPPTSPKKEHGHGGHSVHKEPKNKRDNHVPKPSVSTLTHYTTYFNSSVTTPPLPSTTPAALPQQRVNILRKVSRPAGNSKQPQKRGRKGAQLNDEASERK